MGFSATPKYPAAVAGVGDLLNQKNWLTNTVQPTLASTVNATQTSITLTTGTGVGLPTDNFVITIDSEIIFVGSRATDTLSACVRAYEGTTAATHASLANVDAFITALQHNQLAVEINAIETQLGINLANVELVGQQPVEIVCFFSGLPGAGARILAKKAAFAHTFAANLAGSQCFIGTNATATATYTFKKNGTQFGTLAITSAGALTWTTTGGATVAFAVGDYLEIVAPSTQDTTLADVSISLYATR